MTKTTLSALLGIGAGDIVSIVGAGGKTTTMYRLCHELAAQELTAISTTTTAIMRPSRSQSPVLLVESELRDLIEATRDALAIHRHVTVVGGAPRPDKLAGVSRETVAALAAVADVVVVEPDGARHNAIKAPAEHEPVVPLQTTHFLSVAGLHALGRPLTSVCHRPELAARIASQQPDSVVTAATISRLLRSPEGGLKGRPERAAAWALLTHLTDENEEEARAVASCLTGKGYTGVLALSRERTLRLL